MPLTEIEKQITAEVLTRFLTEKKPTARKPLSTQYKDPNSLNRLIDCWVLRPNTNRNLFLPMALAFHYCADENTLRAAKRSVAVVVRELQDLFTAASEEYPQFTPTEIETQARQSDKEVTADLIRLGLYFAQEFGFLNGWTPAETERMDFKSICALELKFVGANEYILPRNAEGIWDEYIQQRIAQFEPPQSLKIREPNVLLRALRVFCADVQLLDLLTHPHEVTPKKLTQGAAFELYVGWFLSLFGFSTIVLGEYENIVARKTKARRGSLDILAAHFARKLLLVVGCTMNPPKTEDFGHVRNAREIVLREGLGETEYRVTSVLFTAAMGGSRCNTDGAECVPIVDADLMKEFFGLLWKGQEEPFFEFLQEPDPELPRSITGWGFKDREKP